MNISILVFRFWGKMASTFFLKKNVWPMFSLHNTSYSSLLIKVMKNLNCKNNDNCVCHVFIIQMGFKYLFNLFEKFQKAIHIFYFLKQKLKFF